MMREIARSIQRLIFSPATLYLINCLKNAAPDCDAIQVALISKFVAPLGRASRRILAVLVDQQLCGAEGVGVDHAIAYTDGNLGCQPGLGSGRPR
jgi:hypothetical protein